jgi:hypothetical protein
VCGAGFNEEAMENVMVQANGLALAALILLAMMAGPCGAAERQYSCKGQLIRGEASQDVQPKPIDLSVTLGERNKLSMKTGEGAVLAPRTISDNKIQLKFATKEFVGEYFHYTGDLFLIYPSGQLSRLNCSRT